MADRPLKAQRCAIYTRKSTNDGLEQEFNSLDAQREACEADRRVGSRRRPTGIGIDRLPPT